MKQIFKHSLMLTCLVAIVALAIAYVTGDMSLSDMLFGTGAMGYAMAVPGSANLDGTASATNGQDGVGKHVTGHYLDTPTTIANSPDLIENPVDRSIVQMYQSALPIDQFLRFTKAVPTQGMEYEYYSIDTRPIKSTIALAGGDSATVSVSNATSVAIKVADAKIFNVGDCVRVGKTKAYENAHGNVTAALKNGLYVILYVVARNLTDNTITCQALNAPTAISIANGKTIYRVAPALHEGDMQTAAYSALPTKTSQCMQIFKSQTMESRIHMESLKEVDWTPSDQDEYMLYDFRRAIEAAFIFGCRSKINDINASREVYTCSGIVEQILVGDSSNVITYPSTLDDAYFIDLTKQIFIGNNGSSERYVFMGSELMAKISKINSVDRQLDATSTERTYGVTWKRIETNFGTLKVYVHPLFNEFDFENCAIVVDPQYIQKRVFRSIETNVLKLQEAGVFDGRANVVTEISSIVLKYPKCHKLIVPESFTTNGFFGEA